jgi:hypothetical protein
LQESASKGYCVSKDGGAFCALDPAPRPACQAAYGFQACEGDKNVLCPYQACEGDKILRCLGGYAVTSNDCPPTGTCADAGNQLFCTLDKTPAPQCAGHINVSFCRDGNIEDCSLGWVTNEQRCVNGSTCVPVAGTSDFVCKAP